ncbi:MAG: glycosyltransferase family 2 protein, partial [Planctomycetales bacterium]
MDQSPDTTDAATQPNEGSTPLSRDQVGDVVRLLGPAAAAHLGIFQLPDDFRLSVVMPAYNEESTIVEILHRVLQSPIPKEILVVDDGSTDQTLELIRQQAAQHDEIRVLTHDRNLGKGASLRTAFEQACG